MRKILLFLFAVLMLGVGYMALINSQMPPVEVPDLRQDPIYTTYSSDELGFLFEYRLAPDGYVLEEREPSDSDASTLQKTLILMQVEDSLQEMPEGGEGPAVISISIFENSKKQFPQTWADENLAHSNVNLVMGEISEAVVGGANAIRYMADGLYASENVVVAHGDNIYVITGQYLDESSTLRQDFAPLLESIAFIPEPGQEE
ncbi:MAG TPA: PsbP-related protein [Candidatus Paceibacterota bacterium]|nr:PsbP-related protein [Candidatus Paceibacterota bacterium]